MFTTPGVMPVTTPVELTVATAGLPLVHAPPAGVAANAVVEPVQTVLLPVITGAVFTVTVTLDLFRQPQVLVEVTV